MEISPLVVGLISFVIILVALATGMWIFAALAVAGYIVAAVFLGSMALMPYMLFSFTNSFILTAVATFVFMGEVFVNSKTNDFIYRGVSTLLRRLHGSLYYANIGACTVFAAISGSAVAASATMGSVSLPEMEKRGYNRQVALGTVAGAGLLGGIIPPSITMIIYGSLTGVSIGRMFIAGIIPGIIMSAMMMSYIFILLKLRPHYAPSLAGTGQTLKKDVKDILGLLPVFAIVVVVLGSIYTGIATPSEAGAVGALSAVVLAAGHRTLTPKVIKDSAFGALKTVSMIVLIMAVSTILSSVYGALRIPRLAAEWTVAVGATPLMILVAVSLLYIILGLFIDTIPVMILTLGTIHPLMVQVGYDPVWLGVVITVLAMAGMITPPVGVSLYITQAVAPGSTLMQISKGAFPFFLILIMGIVMLVIWPELAIWLPNQLMG